MSHYWVGAIQRSSKSDFAILTTSNKKAEKLQKRQIDRGTKKKHLYRYEDLQNHDNYDASCRFLNSKLR